MKYFSRIFAPTNNRRLNELIGFLFCISGLLLFLALASYSPLDPSFNSASVLTGSRAARNWIGMVGAIVSDLMLQGFGIGAFLLPVFSGRLGSRWFRSRKVVSPVAKSLGGIWLLMFVPALLALLPGHSRWDGRDSYRRLVWTNSRRCAHPLLESGRRLHCLRDSSGGRAISDHRLFFCLLQVWAPTRFAFVVALWNRYKDWQETRAKTKMQKELEKRRAARPTVITQMIQARNRHPRPRKPAPAASKPGHRNRAHGIASDQ